MSDSLAEQVRRAFSENCRCGYKRYILLRGVFKWRWCEYCDGTPMPPDILPGEEDE